MLDLFKAECARFRAWAIAFAVLHLLVLGFMTRMVDLAQQPLLVYRVIGGIHVLTGILFGLYQMGSYRRPNTWLNLLHRPLPHRQVAFALMGAAAALLMLAIAAPIAATALWQETMTARVVDLRHWLLPLSALLLAACGYLAGAYCMLGNRRYAVSGLVFLVLIAGAQSGGWAAIAVQSLAMVWLSSLVLIAFKPDLSAAPRRWLAVVVTALPLQMGIYYLLILFGFGVELLWIIQGTHPNNSAPPHGGYVEAIKAEGRDLMRDGLAASSAADAPLWGEQVALSEVFGVGRTFDNLPVRGELTNIAPMEFDDDERRVRWVFSHDSMRFEGYGLADGRAAGVLGVGAEAAGFATPPLPTGAMPGSSDSVLIGSGTLYQYDSESMQVQPRIVLPAGEAFAAKPNSIGESMAVLSNRALYFFDGRGVVEHRELLTPRLRAPLSGSSGNLSRVDLIELVDGYLISFTFASTAHNGKADPYQDLLHVHDDGRIEPVGHRALGADYPDWHRYQLWWLSPFLHEVHDGAAQLFADPSPLLARTLPPVPRAIWWLALTLLMLSMLLAFWRSGRQGLRKRERILWTLAGAVIGIPALASLWLLYPSRNRLDIAECASSHRLNR